MRPGKTFRIGTQEHAQPVLRTFMLLSVAGDSPTTRNCQAKTPIHVVGVFAFARAKLRGPKYCRFDGGL